MKILANKHLYRIKEFFPDNADLQLFDPERLPDNAPACDALLINTTTAINQSTLPDPGNIKIIATGSSGHDHVDVDYLESTGVQFEAASGCNAQSVAEYVITAILCHAFEQQISLKELNVGIAGCGHTGSAVAKLLDNFSISKTLYDPPRQNREPGFKSALFEQFAECNVLTFHTPYTTSGTYPTKYLLNESWFKGKKYELIINAARGGVVNEELLAISRRSGNVKAVVLDVWENEPLFNDRIANICRFATPHIAGYSVQSKFRASKIIAEAVCRKLGLKPLKPITPEPLILNEEELIDLTFPEFLTNLHSIKKYHELFIDISGKNADQKREAFYQLRTDFPLRYEYSAIRVPYRIAEKFTQLEKLGCKIQDQ